MTSQDMLRIRIYQYGFYACYAYILPIQNGRPWDNDEAKFMYSIRMSMRDTICFMGFKRMLLIDCCKFRLSQRFAQLPRIVVGFNIQHPSLSP